jgi:aryl-alcohol dehydrogenase-like predicted oxidoreductase
MITFGRTNLEVFEICLGGNVFGWTINETQSRGVLDAYAAIGGNFIDTANVYQGQQGRSETIIGRWMADRGCRDQIVIATKVGGGSGEVANLKPETIEREAQSSLDRLRTDRIDLYYAHYDDERTPLEDSLRAFDGLVRTGTVRYIAASNYSPARLAAAIELQRANGLAEFTVLQPRYNLVERDFERTGRPIVDAWDLAVAAFFGLAQGFLTGKYRPGGGFVDSPRAKAASTYLTGRGAAVLEVLDEVAEAHQATVAAVALAWLRAQPRVVPIASARTPAQIEEMAPAANLELTPAEISRLSDATGESA